jgi:cytochrome oxidase assembly protein ShyY1
MLRTLRQPRYAGLSLLMLLVALVCIGAGTWQIARFAEKVHANDQLRGNAHAAPVPVAHVLPLVGHGSPSTDAVLFRTITAAGRYDTAHQALVRQRSVHGSEGFYVLTPLRTARGVLLVARGFVAADGSGNPPTSVAPAPSGPTTVHARVEIGESKPDTASGVPAGQLNSINPGDQATRLGAPVFNGYAQLLAGQPGSNGLTAIPGPNLSNPAGGAVEPQHFAYIIQWYLFAMLAVAAPFAMIRADRRAARAEPPRPLEPADKQVRLSAPDVPNAAPAASVEEQRAAKLADRYGRPTTVRSGQRR